MASAVRSWASLSTASGFPAGFAAAAALGLGTGVGLALIVGVAGRAAASVEVLEMTE
jgi:hypothetical protein